MTSRGSSRHCRTRSRCSSLSTASAAPTASSRAERNGVDPGNFHDGTPLAKPNVAAFQHAWFYILATQLGFAGCVKWDCFFGKYDRGTQAYYALGPPPPPGHEEWEPFPFYFLLQLITTTTGTGWSALKVANNGGDGHKHLVAFQAHDKTLTILGLDDRGASINTPSGARVDYAIGNLPPNTSFTLALWNRARRWVFVNDSTVRSDASRARAGQWRAAAQRVRADYEDAHALGRQVPNPGGAEAPYGRPRSQREASGERTVAHVWLGARRRFVDAGCAWLSMSVESSSVNERRARGSELRSASIERVGVVTMYSRSVTAGTAGRAGFRYAFFGSDSTRATSRRRRANLGRDSGKAT